MHDAYNSHSYLLRFFRKCFSLQQIAEFSDQGLQRFINEVVNFRQLARNVTLKEWVSQHIYLQAVPVTATRQTERNRSSKTVRTTHATLPKPDNIYFNPQGGGLETFRRRSNIPDLGPWDSYHRPSMVKSPRKAIFRFINKQNVRLAYEHEPANIRQPRETQPLTSEILACNPQ